MTENKGIWQNGMYIPPELVDDLMKQYEGMPVKISGSDQVVGHVTNVRRVESGLSFDISRTLEGEEALERIQKMEARVSVSSSEKHDDRVIPCGYALKYLNQKAIE